MRDSGCEQADRRELLRLRELGLELNAIGDVVDEDDAADGDEVSRDQRSNGDVGDADFAGGKRETELVERVRALLVANALKRETNSAGKSAESGWRSASVRGLAYMTSICAFQLSMRSSRSTAKMPMLMDSTMFSWNSFSRSKSVIFCSRRR